MGASVYSWSSTSAGELVLRLILLLMASTVMAVVQAQAEVPSPPPAAAVATVVGVTDCCCCCCCCSGDSAVKRCSLRHRHSTSAHARRLRTCNRPRYMFSFNTNSAEGDTGVSDSASTVVSVCRWTVQRNNF